MLTKAVLEFDKVVVISPGWGLTGEAAEWRPLLDRVTKIRVRLTDVPFYVPHGAKNPLPAPPYGVCPVVVARSQQKKIKTKEKDAQPEKMKRKIVFSNLRNPPKNFTLLFGEVAKFRTLTKKDEQKSRHGEGPERCLPQNT